MNLKKAVKSRARPIASWALNRLALLRDAEAVRTYDFGPDQVREIKELMARYDANRPEIRTINWLLPGLKHPLFGGVHTILRFADYFSRNKGIQNRIIFCGGQQAMLPSLKEKIGASFPVLVDSISGLPDSNPAKLPDSDIGIATYWTSAYLLLHARTRAAKFYFIQDFEPSFYPAGATYGVIEATYRMGYWGIVNTTALANLMRDSYGMTVKSFQPAVDPKVFYPGSNRRPQPVKVFFYGRPGNPRNGFVLGIESLKRVKKRFGDRVQIVSAGGVWEPSDFGARGVLENLGLLSRIEDVAALYRTCHIGLSFMFTRHPSYQPMEMMASGVAVITNENPALKSVLKNNENCMVAEPTATSIAEAICLLATNAELRSALAAEGVRVSRQACWETEMEKVYQFMVGQHGTENMVRQVTEEPAMRRQ